MEEKSLMNLMSHKLNQIRHNVKFELSVITFVYNLIKYFIFNKTSIELLTVEKQNSLTFFLLKQLQPFTIRAVQSIK